MSSSKTKAKSVDRVINILEAIAKKSHGMAHADVCSELNLNKSTAHYTLQALEQRGFLRREPETLRYHLGLSILSLGHDLLTGVSWADAAAPALARLIEESGEFIKQGHPAAHVAVMDHGEAVYVAKHYRPGFLGTHTWIGQRLPAHAVAVGKAMLAYLAKSEVDVVVNKPELEEITDKTITSPERFRETLKQVAELGYAVDDQESCKGVRCVAAPIIDSKGIAIASVSVTGTVFQIDEDNAEKLAEQVKGAAEQIARRLGLRN